MLELPKIREEIDAIDREIVSLFERRMDLGAEVARYKMEAGKPVLDRDREQEKLKAVSAQAKDSFTAAALQELFRQMMASSRKLQYRIMGEAHPEEKFPFIRVHSLPMGRKKVVFQGEEGAYSFTAMNSFFGESVDNFHVATWKDAMDAISEGKADYAVLPIENSTAPKNSRIEDIRTVYSHPQALAQCKKFLDRHPEWKQVPWLNTATAAKKVKEDADLTQAAIASPYAAQCFGLQILKPHVFSSQSNSTRFIIVSGKNIYTESAGKISICFEIPHESGSLYNILSHFIFNNLNMTKIESRPIPERNWEYRFFVDIEGNLGEAPVQNALQGIAQEAANMRIIGNY